MININLEDIDYYCLTILKNEKRRDNILKMNLKNLLVIFYMVLN